MRIFTTVALCLFSCLLHAQKINLALHLEMGKTYYQSTEATINVSQNINEQTSSSKTSLQSKMSFKVIGITDSVYEMECRFLTMSSKKEQGGITKIASSEAVDTSNAESVVFNLITRKNFKTYLYKNGRVKDIDGLDFLYDDLAKALKIPDAQQKKIFITQIKKIVGERAIRASMNAVTAFVPDHDVMKNDRWTINDSLETGVSMAVNSVFQLKEVNTNDVVIRKEGTLESNPNLPVELGAYTFFYNLHGTSSADIKVDRRSGWVLQSVTRQDIKGSMDIKDTPQTPGGMSIPIEISNTTEIKG